MAGEVLIDIRDLSVGFTGRSGETLPILRNIDLAVSASETIGLVGESGSGKSTLALAMMGYLKRGLRVIGGSTAFRDRATFDLTDTELREIRGGELALIPQNAGQSLTPTMKIGAQITEALALHSRAAEAGRPARVVELLAQVRLPEPAALVSRYPHELTGGQQQRVAIAMALAGEPDALLLDEPTTGLDVTTQAHVLELLRDLSRETGTAMVYVSHDLGAIARVCDRVAVMYAGEIVLEGDRRQVLLRPVHPYARGLLASIPRLATAGLPVALEGRPPPRGAPAPAAPSPTAAVWPRSVASKCARHSNWRRAVSWFVATDTPRWSASRRRRRVRERIGSSQTARLRCASTASQSATPSRAWSTNCWAANPMRFRPWPTSRSPSSLGKRSVSSANPAAASPRS